MQLANYIRRTGAMRPWRLPDHNADLRGHPRLYLSPESPHAGEAFLMVEQP